MKLILIKDVPGLGFQDEKVKMNAKPDTCSTFNSIHYDRKIVQKYCKFTYCSSAFSNSTAEGDSIN